MRSMATRIFICSHYLGNKSTIFGQKGSTYTVTLGEHGSMKSHSKPLTDAMIDIDSPYALPPGARMQFSEQGFIKLREVFSPATLTHYGDEITRLTLALNTQQLPLEQRNTYNKAFLQVANLWESSARVR